MRDPEFQDLDLEFFEHESETPGMKPDLWQRLSRMMEALLYLLILAAILRIFWPEIEHQKELNAQLAQVEAVKLERQKQLNQLNREYEWLKSDRDYLENFARDRLELYRKGEYVVRIEREEEAAPAEIGNASEGN